MMTDKSAFDPMGVARAKRERRQNIHTEATEYGNTMRQAFERAQQESVPELVDQGNNEMSNLGEISQSAQAAETIIDKARLDVTPFPPHPAPFVPEPIVPKPPVMQSYSPTASTAPAQGQSPTPDPTLQRPRPLQRKDDRAQFEEMGKPPVPLTPEQQELCAWIYLRRQLRTEELMLAERRLGIVSQVVGITLGIVSIVGGIIAVRQGLKAAANDYRS